MNMLLNIKLIIRSWWRNKTYFFISLFSLTIGLACTNLLVTFFIQEYNISGWQIAIHDTLIGVLVLQFRNRNRTEDFIGCTES